MTSQTDQIRKHLERHGSITPWVAVKKYRCLRLAARIYDLRCQGMTIHTELLRTNKAPYARYYT